LETGGPVIGLLRQCYQQGSFVLKPGDLLALFTDGVSESMNTRNEEWGEARLIEVAKTCHGVSACEAMTRILAAAEAFAAGAPQHDDMTLVVLRVLT
jgi:sigma-B regulation protein RsbU (phosphoserine phosphatase)